MVKSHAVSHDGKKAVSCSHRSSQGIWSLAAFHTDFQPVFLFLYLCVFLHSQVLLAFISESFMNYLVWTGLPLGICTWKLSIIVHCSKSFITAPNLCAKCVLCDKSLQLCLNLCHPVDWSVALRLPCPWDSPSKNTGEGYYALLQGIFLTQESNSRLISPALAGGFFTTISTWEAF